MVQRRDRAWCPSGSAAISSRPDLQELPAPVLDSLASAIVSGMEESWEASGIQREETVASVFSSHKACHGLWSALRLGRVAVQGDERMKAKWDTSRHGFCLRCREIALFGQAGSGRYARTDAPMWPPSSLWSAVPWAGRKTRARKSHPCCQAVELEIVGKASRSLLCNVCCLETEWCPAGQLLLAHLRTARAARPEFQHGLWFCKQAERRTALRGL